MKTAREVVEAFFDAFNPLEAQAVRRRAVLLERRKMRRSVLRSRLPSVRSGRS